MSKNPQNSLVDFMKKQAAQKNAKQNHDNKSNAKALFSKVKKDGKKDENAKDDEEMTEEEKLEQAKKESRSKSANVDKTEMFKRLILESFAKYALIIILVSGSIILIIQLIPIIGSFFNGFITKFLLSGAK